MFQDKTKFLFRCACISRTYSGNKVSDSFSRVTKPDEPDDPENPDDPDGPYGPDGTQIQDMTNCQAGPNKCYSHLSIYMGGTGLIIEVLYLLLHCKYVQK